MIACGLDKGIQQRAFLGRRGLVILWGELLEQGAKLRESYLIRSRAVSPSFRSEDQGASGAYTSFANAIRALSYWLRILTKARQLSSRSALSRTPTLLNCSHAASYSARVTCIETPGARAEPRGIPTSVAMSESVRLPTWKQRFNQGTSPRSTVEEYNALASRLAPAVVIHHVPG